MYKRTIRLASAIQDWTKLKKLPASEKSGPVGPDTFEKVSEAKISTGLLIQQKFAEDLCLKLNDQLAIGAKLHKLQVAKLTYEELVSQMSSKFIVQTVLKE